MKTLKKTFFLVLLLNVITFLTNAQKLELEKTYEIDAKAKRGFLDEVYINSTDKTTVLSFGTKVNTSKTLSGKGDKVKIKYQNYIFDKDYNFVKMEEKEEEYHSGKFKGEYFVVEGVSIGASMMGDLVLKKKKVEYTWSWYNKNYSKKVTVLDKVKPKTEAGNKFTLLKTFENDETGDGFALVKVRATKENPNVNQYEYYFLRISQDLNVEVVETIQFSKCMSVYQTFIIPAEGDNESDEICILFKATNTPDEGKLGDKNDFEMWRVSNQGKLLKRVEFKVKACDWDIEQMISKGGSLYFVGPAKEGKDLSTSLISSSGSWGDNPKWKLYQLAKITGDKVDYVTTTNLEDFEAKLKKPENQKKNPAYSGKRFDFNYSSVAKDGSLFICGQNKNSKGEFLDILMFYFDNTGTLKAQYGVRPEEMNDDAKFNSCSQFVKFSDNYAYWEVWEMVGFKDEAGNGEKAKALVYPNIAKINLATGDISNFQKFGTVKDKPTYFLQNDFPNIINPSNGSYTYLGINKKGNIFWFGKIIFE